MCIVPAAWFFFFRFQGADEAICKLCEGVHGPLLDALAKQSSYHDRDAVNLFRHGGPLVGTLAKSGNCAAPCRVTHGTRTLFFVLQVMGKR